MFNKKLKKRIKELEVQIERQIKRLEDRDVTEHTTGLLIRKSNATAVKVIQEHTFYSWGCGDYTEEVKSERYYLEGKAPQCDYIKIDLKGNETMYKNDVVVDTSGKCLIKK